MRASCGDVREIKRTRCRSYRCGSVSSEMKNCLSIAGEIAERSANLTLTMTSTSPPPCTLYYATKVTMNHIPEPRIRHSQKPKQKVKEEREEWSMCTLNKLDFSETPSQCRDRNVYEYNNGLEEVVLCCRKKSLQCMLGVVESMAQHRIFLRLRSL